MQGVRTIDEACQETGIRGNATENRQDQATKAKRRTKSLFEMDAEVSCISKVIGTHKGSMESQNTECDGVSKIKDTVAVGEKHGKAQCGNDMERSNSERHEATGCKTTACMDGKDREREQDAEPQNKGKANSIKLYRLLEHQDFRCAACRLALSPDDSELDHVIPRTSGGTDDVHNLQWLCHSCNRAKGRLSMVEFVELCRRVSIVHR